MPMEILSMIIALCAIHSSSAAWITDANQLKCQQHYVECYTKKDIKNMPTMNLPKCILDRKP